jgi:Zn-dependent M28 family amino/carboxypeptidase
MRLAEFWTGGFGTLNRHDSPGGSAPAALADAVRTGPLYALLGAGMVALSGGSAAASAESIDAAGLHRHIAVLASDEFEGRWPGTRGEQRTLDYLQQEFKAAGAKPGNGDRFLQPVPLVQWTLDPEPTLVVRGAQLEASLEFREDMVARTLRQEADIAVVDSPVVFAGYGVVAPEHGWNDYEGLDSGGKTVILLVNDPGFESGNPALFNGRAMTYYGRWTYKYEEAARQGADAILIVHETEPASYGWAVVSQGAGEHFGLATEGAGDAPVPIEGWISASAAKRLFAAAGEDFSELKAAALRPGFSARALGDLRADLRVRSAIRESTSHNVAALVPGAVHPDEYVIFTAHWDHLGREGDQIFNGAVDNASGTAGLLLLAEAYAMLDPPPERSILFLAVTAEEQGLLGSEFYARNPIVPLEQTVAVINVDVLNYIGPTRDITVVGYGASGLDAFVDAAAAAHDRQVMPDQRPEAGTFYRSDHFSFAKQGVPALFPRMGRDLVDGGAERGRVLAQAYTAERYHQATDEYSPEQDWRGGAADLKLFFDFGLGIANSREWPNWVEGNEFRALRDAQRAGP